MDLKESINSDDIEIAELAANLLLEEVGYEKVTELIDKYRKYTYELLDKKIYLRRLYSFKGLWNHFKMVNTPLLSMTELKNNTIYINEEDGEIIFNMPYKIEKEDGK